MISVITCVSDYDKYDRIVMPCLHKATSLLWSLGLPGLDTICVEGKNFETLVEAYSEGRAKAKNPIQVFIHDDLDLIDPSWVFKLIWGFANNPKCAVIGLVGTTNVCHTSNWWENGNNFIYGSQFYRKDRSTLNFNTVPLNGKFDRTIQCVDGSFIALNRKEIIFDSSIKDKYFMTAYEHDTCRQAIAKGFDIGLINHMSWHVCQTGDEGLKSIDSIKKEVSEILYKYLKKWNMV